jgi:hypothetical protein
VIIQSPPSSVSLINAATAAPDGVASRSSASTTPTLSEIDRFRLIFHLPASSVMEILGDQAGMHILVRFRNVEREPDPAHDGVRLTSASKYYFSNAPSNEYVMGFTAVTERALREGVSRLQRGWNPRAKGA